ncbi:MAG: imidazole glycerol phosphate synthase subunit HisH [Candidatus Goldbacteria bacterium]|nr:imidazole glycerol phosphate synthase subunit HisH [Candidatus Goldiibacteriota bacterium]
MGRIVIVDYGMGNLHSVSKAFAHIKASVKVSDKPEDIKKASGLVLPGVGAFGDAIKQLKARKLYMPVKEAGKAGKPILGICLGMQLLMAHSEEFGSHKGFGFIKGKVVRFAGKMKIPHMGWNNIMIQDKSNPVIKGINDNAEVYFVHSYYTLPEDKKDTLCVTDYAGVKFASAVSRGNIFGFQFHPEKSGEKMLKIYKNFNKFVENRER